MHTYIHTQRERKRKGERERRRGRRVGVVGGLYCTSIGVYSI
jgi:hypothetical protein